MSLTSLEHLTGPPPAVDESSDDSYLSRIDLANTDPMDEVIDKPIAVTTESGRPAVLVHRKVEVEGAKAPVRYSMELPEGSCYDGFKLQIPGFGGIKRSSRAERNASASLGIRTISYDPPRRSTGFCEKVRRPQKLHTRAVAAIIQDVQDNAAEIRSHTPEARTLDFGRFMLSPHSMGGFPATYFAEHNPQIVESVIHKASASFGCPDLSDVGGMVQNGNFTKFGREIASYVASGQIEANTTNLGRILNYYFCDLLRTAGEARSCISLNTVERAARLRDNGIGTAFMAFGEDILVPATKVQEKAARAVDRFVIMPGVGHTAPQTHPSEVAYWGVLLHEIVTGTQLMPRKAIAS